MDLLDKHKERLAVVREEIDKPLKAEMTFKPKVNKDNRRKKVDVTIVDDVFTKLYENRKNVGSLKEKIVVKLNNANSCKYLEGKKNLNKNDSKTNHSNSDIKLINPIQSSSDIKLKIMTEMNIPNSEYSV